METRGSLQGGDRASDDFVSLYFATRWCSLHKDPNTLPREDSGIKLAGDLMDACPRVCDDSCLPLLSTMAAFEDVAEAAAA